MSTYNGYNSFHFFKEFVFAEFQINFHCCAGKRNKYTDEHFNMRCGPCIDLTLFFVLFFSSSDRWCDSTSNIYHREKRLFCLSTSKASVSVSLMACSRICSSGHMHCWTHSVMRFFLFISINVREMPQQCVFTWFLIRNIW